MFHFIKNKNSQTKKIGSSTKLGHCKTPMLSGQADTCPHSTNFADGFFFYIYSFIYFS